MNKCLQLTLSLICITSICTTAFGRRPPPPPRPSAANNAASLYFDGNIGYGKVHQTLSGDDYNGNKGFTWNVAAGYQLNEFLTLEVGYIKLPEVTGNLGYHTHAWDLVAKIALPLNPQFNIFVKGGAATSPQSDPLLAVGGLGASYFMSPEFSITAQALNIFGSPDLPNTIMGTIGFSYKISS